MESGSQLSVCAGAYLCGHRQADTDFAELPVNGPSFLGAPCDQPLPTNEPLRSPWTVPVDSGAIAAASSEGRAAGGGGGPSGVFRCIGLFDRRRRFFFDSFFRRFFSFLRRFRSLRSRLVSLSSLLEEEEDSLRRRRPMPHAV